MKQIANQLSGLIRLRFHREASNGLPAWTNITQLFRNPPQLRLIAKLLSAKNSCRVAVYGVADGSEAVSLLLSLDPFRTKVELQIKGLDICHEYLAHAENFTFSARHFPTNINPRNLGVYLERVDEQSWRVKTCWRALISYAHGDVLKVEPGSVEEPYDLVMCQNVITLMSAKSCERAICNLVKLVKPGGILALGGGPLGLIHRIAISHELEPILDDVAAIHEAWTVQRQFYGKPRRPDWALEPFNSTHPEGATRYCTLFRKLVRR
jgi:SAM-dependent methyltransferase